MQMELGWRQAILNRIRNLFNAQVMSSAVCVHLPQTSASVHILFVARCPSSMVISRAKVGTERPRTMWDAYAWSMERLQDEPNVPKTLDKRCGWPAHHRPQPKLICPSPLATCENASNSVVDKGHDCYAGAAGYPCRSPEEAKLRRCATCCGANICRLTCSLLSTCYKILQATSSDT